jgi:hypothetical protein
MTCQLALEATVDVAGALAFADAAFDVVARGSVRRASRERDRVEGLVELTVAASVESVADRLAGRGGYRARAGEHREGGFRSGSDLGATRQ